MRSFARAGAVFALLLAVTCSILAPQAAEAQGWKNRLKQAAGAAAGLTGAGEAVAAAKAARDFVSVRNTPTPVAGTYQLTYVLNDVDSQTVFVRTLTKPDIPLAATGGGEDADFTRGYLMNLLVARTVDSLPADWDAFVAWAKVQQQAIEAEEKARKKNKHAPVALPASFVGAGWFRVTRDSVGSDGLGRYALIPGAYVVPRTAADSAFWLRVGDGISVIGASLNAQNEAAERGLGDDAVLASGMLGARFHLTAPDQPIAITWRYARGDDHIRVVATRVSTVALARP